MHLENNQINIENSTHLYVLAVLLRVLEEYGLNYANGVLACFNLFLQGEFIPITGNLNIHLETVLFINFLAKMKTEVFLSLKGIFFFSFSWIFYFLLLVHYTRGSGIKIQSEPKFFSKIRC